MKKDEKAFEYFKTLEMKAQNLIFELPVRDSEYWDQLSQHGRFHFRDWEIEAVIHHLSRIVDAAKKASEYHQPQK